MRDGREKIEVLFHAQDTTEEAERLAAATQDQGIPAWLDDEGEHHYDFDLQVEVEDDDEGPKEQPVDQAVLREVEAYYIKYPPVANAKAALVKDEGVGDEVITVIGREKRLRDITQEDEAAMSDREYEIYFKKAKRG